MRLIRAGGGPAAQGQDSRPFQVWRAMSTPATLSRLCASLWVSLIFLSLQLGFLHSQAASERGSFTQRDGTALQTQFGVFRPENLIGLRWLLSEAMLSPWARRTLSPPGTIKSGLGAHWFSEKGGLLGRQPQVCQAWHRETVIWL